MALFGKVDNGFKLLFKVSVYVQVLLHIGQKGSGVRPGYCPLGQGVLVMCKGFSLLFKTMFL
jgi:hypothetical protein